MADPSPPAGLSDRAGRVFSLAGQLGRALRDERRKSGGGVRQTDPGCWDRHRPAFDAFCAAVLDLRGEMQRPPDGFAPVAEALLEAARVARRIRDVMQTPGGRTWQEFLDFSPALASVAEAGRRAVEELAKAGRPDDPFAFVDQPPMGRGPAAAAPPGFIDRLLAGPDDAELSPRDLALLDAHLRQPVTYSTIISEREALGRSPTAERRNKLKLIRDFNRGLQKVPAPDGTPGGHDGVAPAATPAGPATTSPKRSTHPGDGRAKLIAALTEHHRYNGDGLNLEPVANNELARRAGVDKATASVFFKAEFDGHDKYKALCRDFAGLVAALKLLNDEFAPRELYRRPADAGDRDDE